MPTWRQQKIKKIYYVLGILVFTIKVQWLSEQIECGNLQIGKTAVALWIPMAQQWLIPHLKALNVTL